MSHEVDRRPSLLVKICGLTDPEEARACARAGADWIGLNFHPPSPRFVDEGRAGEIIAALPNSAIPVGVFVNRPPAEVAAVAARLRLPVVQLHGDEPPDDLLVLDRVRVIRAFRIGTAADLDDVRRYVDRAASLNVPPHPVLLDARVEGRFGGTGKAIDGDLLDLIRFARDRLPPIILAGGLTPENVAERVARLRPHAVDVAGGVESSPGRKDPARVSTFINAARSAENRR